MHMLLWGCVMLGLVVVMSSAALGVHTIVYGIRYAVLALWTVLWTWPRAAYLWLLYHDW